MADFKVKWDAVAGADKYRVRWLKNSVEEAIATAYTAAATRTISVIVGDTVQVEVTAVNEDAESAPGASGLLQIETLPPLPTPQNVVLEMVLPVG